MDFKKEALNVAEETMDNVSETVSKGVSFLKGSLLRSLVFLSICSTSFILIFIWNDVYFSINANKSFDTFINTFMAVTASPLLLVALYYYFESFASLLKRFKNLTVADKDKHKRNLIISAVCASLAGWAIKLFFLPALFFMIVTVYMFKLLSNKNK